MIATIILGIAFVAIIIIIISAAVVLTPGAVAFTIAKARNSNGEIETVGAAFSYLIETAVSYYLIKMTIDISFLSEFLIIASGLFFLIATIIGAIDLVHHQRVE